MVQVNHPLLKALFFSSVLVLRPTTLQASSSERTNRPTRRKRPVASFLSAPQNGDNYVWYEIPPRRTRYELDPAWSSTTPNKPPRKLLWFGRYDLEEPTWLPTKEAVPSPNPHPLRSQHYTLQVHWTGKWDRGLPNKLQLDFDEETGFCRAMTSQADIVGVGQWQVLPWGLCFTLIDASGAVEYTFTAQLHLNPFGEYAKLLQGSILRYTLLDTTTGGGLRDPLQDELLVSSHRKWFRPVVGTFSGKGAQR